MGARFFISESQLLSFAGSSGGNILRRRVVKMFSYTIGAPVGRTVMRILSVLDPNNASSSKERELRAIGELFSTTKDSRGADSTILAEIRNPSCSHWELFCEHVARSTNRARLKSSGIVACAKNDDFPPCPAKDWLTLW